MPARLAARLRRFEAEQVRPDDPPADGDPFFRIEMGWLPVLVSAPHGARHWRRGRFKGEDRFTAALAYWLHRETGAHAIFSHRRASEDPNFDPGGRYKASVRRLVAAHGICFVLDLHGMSSRHGPAVELGTMHGRSCRRFAPLIVAGFAAQGFDGAAPARLVVDLNFPASGQHTVTRFAAEQLGIEAVQIELAPCCRDAQRAPPEMVKRAFDALRAVVTAVGAG